MILSSLKNSFKFAPAVLKDATLYFGVYFFAFALAILLLFKNSFTSSLSIVLLNPALLFFSSLFTVFIVPYYAFKYSQGKTPKFWDFIRDNIWLVVFSHIKALFIILLFLFLLIVPGLYKSLRFAFLTETVLFDKQTQRSLLKQANLNTRKYFWKILLFFTLSGTASYLLNLLLKITLLVLGSHFFVTWLNVILLFFCQCFFLLWKSMLFFEIKKEKGEKISC